MLTTISSRWRDRRGTYRPAGEVIDTRGFEVAPIDGDAVAKAYVLRNHYSGSYPAARFRFGLYARGQLRGVAVFSVPANDKALACLPGAAIESVELGRFVLDDDVPGNGETWFLARAFELLKREGLVGPALWKQRLPSDRRRAGARQLRRCVAHRGGRMSASLTLETKLRADGHLVLLDVLDDQGEPGRGKRRRVRVRCKLCGARKVMLRQTALLATSCGCLLNSPVQCDRCEQTVIKRGLAAHIKLAHEPRTEPAWWARAREMFRQGLRVASIARAVGISHTQVSAVVRSEGA